MKIVIQRSLNSSVIVDGNIVGQIKKGAVLLVCCEKGDSKESAKKAAAKIGKIRMFTDPETGRMSLDINQIGGEFLAISQFTLSWDGNKGNRPGFDNSMAPDEANELFEFFCKELEAFSKVEKGQFGAHMDVNIHNDGPVTFSLDF